MIEKDLIHVQLIDAFVVITTSPFSRTWLTTRFFRTETRRLALVEQELHTPLRHLIPPPVFSAVRVSAQCFIDHCVYVVLIPLAHSCMVCSRHSSIFKLLLVFIYVCF